MVKEIYWIINEIATCYLGNYRVYSVLLFTILVL